MRISHRSLEEVRRDPRAALSGGSTGGGYNRTLALHDAVYAFHASRDQARGEALLRRHLEKKPHSGDGAYLDYYVEYVGAIATLGNETFSTEQSVTLSLGEGIELGGQINRIDLVPAGGYAAWLFSTKPVRWGSELRMPLLQHFVADLLGVGPRDVSVGFYTFATGLHEGRVYTGSEVKNAMDEARALAEQISKLGSGS